MDEAVNVVVTSVRLGRVGEAVDVESPVGETGLLGETAGAAVKAGDAAKRDNVEWLWGGQTQEDFHRREVDTLQGRQTKHTRQYDRVLQMLRPLRETLASSLKISRK
jgi:hypothetical protein